LFSRKTNSVTINDEDTTIAQSKRQYNFREYFMVATRRITTAIALSLVALTTSFKAVSQPNSFAQTILTVHNQYRSDVNVPDLTWSDSLAQDAQQWADELAERGGDLQHSENRNGQGENLWAGTAEAFSYEDMVEGWGSEKEYFMYGTFPDVSTTGEWSDVGHYTQMIWVDTTEVGCAIASGGGNDVLVCRYSPAGNYLGQSVY
jgi:Cysteine-rich secretory protein family